MITAATIEYQQTLVVQVRSEEMATNHAVHGATEEKSRQDQMSEAIACETARMLKMAEEFKVDNEKKKKEVNQIRASENKLLQERARRQICIQDRHIDLERDKQQEEIRQVEKIIQALEEDLSLLSEKVADITDRTEECVNKLLRLQQDLVEANQQLDALQAKAANGQEGDCLIS